ncbi:MAG: hypothetical protein ACXWV0_04185 [Flavisolibacter sp.]
MSQAFVKEGDAQWLHDVQPTLNALLVFLTSENNGIRVNEKRNYILPGSDRTVHEMSNGLSYTKNKEGQWEVLW